MSDRAHFSELFKLLALVVVLLATIIVAVQGVSHFSQPTMYIEGEVVDVNRKPILVNMGISWSLRAMPFDSRSELTQAQANGKFRLAHPSAVSATINVFGPGILEKEFYFPKGHHYGVQIIVRRESDLSPTRPITPTTP